MPIAPDGGFLLAGARFCAVSALLSSFGSLLFRTVVLPKVVLRCPEAGGAEQSIRRMARWSLAAAPVALLVWGVLQSAEFAHTGADLRLLERAWPVVLLHTRFGHVLLGQMATVLAAGWLVPRLPRAALGLAGAALLLQAGHSHSASMEGGPSLLLASDMMHLAAAGAWLGGLWPLLIVVRGWEPRAGALAARWFSPLGKGCVAGLVLSAGIQFWVLIGGVPGLVGTPYGWMAMAKLALLVGLLGFAVLNRYRLAPALMRADPAVARLALIRSVTMQTGLGLAAVLAASLLSSLPPAMHEQPSWPFPWRPSFEVMSEPELASEVRFGAVVFVAALVLLASLAWPRLRRGPPLALVLLGAGALIWSAWPQLSLLFVEAYPTSYYVSPSNFAAASIVQGARLYPTYCASCHGAQGRGDGPAAAGLPLPAADLTQAHLWAHSDGEMFWWLSQGIKAPDGSLAMPGFAAALSVAQRWALIDAVRARYAGLAWSERGAWPVPVRLPSFDITCPAQGSTTTDTLLGRVVYVVVEQDGTPNPAAPRGDVVSVLLEAGRHDPSWPGCVAGDPAGRQALAILVGRTPEALAGFRLLVDPDGWLRVAQPGGAMGDDAAGLAAAVQDILARPLSAAGAHHHGE